MADPTTTPVWAQLGYLVAAVCFILALRGLAAPRTSRIGNLVGAAGAVLAVAVTFAAVRPDNLLPILVAIALGAAVGAVAARRVVMTAMPQLVALFNGVGGASAALVALLELRELGELGGLADADVGVRIAVAFTVLVGAVSFAGSLVTFGKLQDWVPGRPIVVPHTRLVYGGVLVVTLAAAVTTVVLGSVVFGIVLALLALGVGVLLVLPIGGADVPIVVSLLNAFTGLSVAASGYLLGNALLLVAGTLVGAAGTLLTRLMAQAMGRSVTTIVFGGLAGPSTQGATEESSRPVKSAGAGDIAVMLGYARRVVLIPGYGLAVAQAQHVLRELAEALAARDVEVVYAIHPVAGRMPGHMNVLLAEADVPYEQLVEMADVNSEFRATDVALVVGANDVVNPSAREPFGSPIAGMPILNADEARAVVFLKRSMRPGFAGIENPLLHDPKTTVLFGDAKESLTRLVAALRSV
ncbi:NAD(P) transhydrogenase subunit beta [Actinopolymorpha cephalotaxi]|uniref:NAD(P) transhydrogenase subunit beta n=1 Tax=Actinopolymorpha cephalotaxi TaxID=504797 RepID=A0A1I2MTA4_9ACTN|nr:NAD(P)(+) transhydrogenase (Re/Si-specific) subunit beta [Actinopolymorpha cephalotaxi]NYH85844.1 NAD(P) transhydrogenase subunit beta [Actinopolymorpha cephalotaxi]SFF94764.1 NAD(P) transhydrogenase subunit beta [Actinopolymorpha cephalotaxi]